MGSLAIALGSRTPIHGPEPIDRIDLWDRYRQQGDGAARAELLEMSVRLVHISARTLLRTVERSLGFDELVSAGTVGLVQALERFDPEAGISFHYYAARRIRGAMLDELRRQRPLTRQLRRRTRQIEEARKHLESTLQRPPREGELAEELGVSLAAYWGWRQQLESRRTVALDSEEALDAGLPDRLPDVVALDPLESMVAKEQSHLIRRGLALLPQRDRLVLSLSFYEGLRLQEIGLALGVTEARVCQLRGRALRRLRDRIGELAKAPEEGAVREAA